MERDRDLSMRRAAIGLCAIALAAHAAAANLVSNGSMDFTDAGGHALPAGSQNLAGTNPNTLTGWTFVSPGATAEYWVSFGGEASPDGGSYLGIQDLDGFAPRNNVVGISQEIGGLTVGDDYTLSFWSMSNHDGNGVFQDWVVSFGGQTQTGLQTTPNTDQTGIWVQSTMNFTASAVSQTLTFVAQYLPGSVPQMLDLDGVQLTAVSTVPEPAAWALLMAGLGAAALGVRRRRRG